MAASPFNRTAHAGHYVKSRGSSSKVRYVNLCACLVRQSSEQRSIKLAEELLIAYR
jgi:hypothetical protein